MTCVHTAFLNCSPSTLTLKKVKRKTLLPPSMFVGNKRKLCSAANIWQGVATLTAGYSCYSQQVNTLFCHLLLSMITQTVF